MSGQAQTPLLVVQDLAKHYPHKPGWLQPMRWLKALDGVSFSVQAASTLAVVGESGCGKSTLARQLALLETPTAGSICLQGVRLEGADAATQKRMRPLVQMVFQNPYASLNPRKRVSALLEEALKINTNLDAAARRERSEAMLARVGLRPEHAGRYPHMFSGGQRQRIAIARALMTTPALVIADEPVSALDVSVQAQVLNLLKDLQQQSGLAYVFISHNLAVVEHLADEVLVMYLGRVVEQASRAALFAHPRHPYTRALLAATPQLLAQRETRVLARGEAPSPLDPPPGCAYASRCAKVQPRCREARPALLSTGGHAVACHFPD